MKTKGWKLDPAKRAYFEAREKAWRDRCRDRLMSDFKMRAMKADIDAQIRGLLDPKVNTY